MQAAKALKFPEKLRICPRATAYRSRHVVPQVGARFCQTPPRMYEALATQRLASARRPPRLRVDRGQATLLVGKFGRLSAHMAADHWHVTAVACASDIGRSPRGGHAESVRLVYRTDAGERQILVNLHAGQYLRIGRRRGMMRLRRIDVRRPGEAMRNPAHPAMRRRSCRSSETGSRASLFAGDRRQPRPPGACQFQHGGRISPISKPPGSPG